MSSDEKPETQKTPYKFLWSTSIQHRFIALLVIIVSLTFMIFSMIFISTQRNKAEEDLNQRLMKITRFAQLSLGTALWQYNDRYVDDFLKSLFIYEDIVFVRIFEEEKVFVQKNKSSSPDFKFDDFVKSRRFITSDTPIKYNENVVGRIQLVLSLERLNKQITTDIIATIGILVALLVAILLTVIYMNSNYLFKPLLNLESSAKEIASGNLDASIDTSSDDEVGKLAKTVEMMIGNIKKITASRDELEREISDRKNAEYQLLNTLEEKEILLKEVHHRVKNNLQLIQSLLNLQATDINNAEFSSSLLDTRNRISAMALIHENLYQSKNVGKIDFPSYLQGLGNSLLQSYVMPGSNIDLSCHIENIRVPLDIAIPCGLIINELVTNSLQHAFPEGKGVIEIVFQTHDSDHLQLRVCDNGVGLDESEDNAKSSLGMKLVNILAIEQLEGKVEVNTQNGLNTIITFPKE